MATTKQSKTHLYLEDELAVGNFIITPHLGLLHYRLSPSKSGYVQARNNMLQWKVKNRRFSYLN